MQKNEKILVQITAINPTYVLGIYKNYSCICHISEIKHGFVKDINDYFIVKQKYTFKILSINEEQKQIILSYKFKTYRVNSRKQPLETKSGFANLRSYVENILRDKNYEA
jgi:general stress protein 13